MLRKQHACAKKRSCLCIGAQMSPLTLYVSLSQQEQWECAGHRGSYLDYRKRAKAAKSRRGRQMSRVNTIAGHVPDGSDLGRLLRVARKLRLLGTSVLTFALFASSEASAENCTLSNPLRNGFSQQGIFAASVTGSVASTIGGVNTAFLGQQGSAFVSSSGNPSPNQQGGGIWIRGVGGEVTTKSASVTTANLTPVLNPAIDSGVIRCPNRERETFAGVQLGHDISRLNVNGWNIHLGAAAGYLEANSRETNAALRTNFEVPFVGAYLVVNKDRFFAEVMVKEQFYNIRLNDPASNLHHQPFGAHGISVNPSAGYQFSLPENWFIEPSVGFIWSNTKVDAFNAVGLPDGQLAFGNVFD
jgi:hypothetical protein